MLDSAQLVSLLFMFGIVAAAAVAGYLVVLAVRRWSQQEEPAATFTFQDLRDMREKGQITDQEFAAMRAALLAEMGVMDDGVHREEPISDSSEEE